MSDIEENFLEDSDGCAPYTFEEVQVIVRSTREYCAKLVEFYRERFDPNGHGDAYSPYDICTEIAAKIRSGK